MMKMRQIHVYKISVLFFIVMLMNVGFVFGQTEAGINIEKYGAIADGKTLNTKFIQRAINEVSEKGGGTIVFSKGKYLSGSLYLKSNVTLSIDETATLLGSTNPRDYEKLEIKDAPVSPKTDDNSKLALLLAHNAANITITGMGTIDGRGRKLALTIDSLHHAGVLVDPNYNTRSNRPSETVRPKIINFSECSNITIHGVTIKNSACWVQSYELCNNLVIDGITVHSRAFWNNDGMDITDCRNVRITNCDVNSADDGICLKSYYPGYYCDSVYIANCYIRSSASAVKFGTASLGGFKNVNIDNITVKDTYRSAVAIESVDGGFIENVNVSNIVAINTGNAIFIRLGNRTGGKPGMIKNISIKNIKAQIPFGRPDEAYDMRGPALSFFHNQFPSPICGIPGHYIENISLENIEIIYPGRASKGMAYIPLWQLSRIPEKVKDYPEYSMFGELPSWGFYIRHVKGISMKKITLKLDNADYRPAFVFDDVQGVVMENVDLPKEKDQVILRDTNNSKFDKAMGSSVKEVR